MFLIGVCLGVLLSLVSVWCGFLRYMIHKEFEELMEDGGVLSNHMVLIMSAVFMALITPMLVVRWLLFGKFL